MDAIDTIKNKVAPLFANNLSDMVRGIRANKKNEGKYISDQMQVIKDELRSDQMSRKATALQKLTYLQMLGYDITFSSFNVVEVLSSNKYWLKRIAYTCAAQSFSDSTQVILLMTNFFKKDFVAKTQWETGAALNCLANICTPDLARDLAADLLPICNSSRPYVRKRAILALYRIFVKFPDALRPAFPRLKDKLTDQDAGVVSAAVHVICELARKNPRNYISLAPTFFEILNTHQNNNWMLIKVVKLFGALTPMDHRFAKLLVDPITRIINSTPSMSLLYESIQTCIAGLSGHLPTMKLCIVKLRSFIEDPDPNLKYLGLLALHSIMKIHPKAVAEHRDLVMMCLDDEDVTIRHRALDLLTGMVSKKNLKEIVQKLLNNMEHSEGSFRDELINKIVELCHMDQYAHVTDFEWYLSILANICKMQSTSHGKLVAEQILDVIIRVPVVRSFGIQLVIELLKETRLMANPTEGGVCEILDASAWLCGEYNPYMQLPIVTVMESLLQPRVTSLPAHVQATYIQAVLKLFASLVGGTQPVEGDEDIHPREPATPDEVKEAAQLLLNRLVMFTQSVHLEVQERACFVQEMIRFYLECLEQGQDISHELIGLFTETLLPVAKGAQKKVKVPEGLDLDHVIGELIPDEAADEPGFDGDYKATEKDMQELAQMGQEDQETPKSTRPNVDTRFILSDKENIPTTAINEDLGPIQVNSTKQTGKGRGKRRVKPKVYKVSTVEDLPDGAETAPTKTEKGTTEDDDPLSRVDLNAEDTEFVLPVRTHRVVSSPVTAPRSGEPKEPATATKGRGRGKESAPVPVPQRPGTHSNPSPYILRDSPPKESTLPTTPPTTKAATPSSKPRMIQRPTQITELSPDTVPGSPSTRAPTGTTPPQNSPALAAQVTPTKVTITTKDLCKNESIELAYEVKTNPNEKNKMIVALKIRNVSPNELSAFEFSSVDTPNMQMAHTPKFEKGHFVLAPGQVATHQLLFNFKTFSVPQPITGAVKFKKPSGVGSLDFQFAIPCSVFVAPAVLEKSELVALLKTMEFALSTTDVVSSDMAATSQAVGELLHLVPVKNSNNRIYYGRTLQGAHVAILFKEKDLKDGTKVIGVDLKCNDPALAASLVSEVSQARL
ncbi:delta adaptin [Pelomyxa schiedti]|nr:delta adaptin [Pelomyxa schiedti]